MSEEKNHMCVHCVMDTTDETITFDERGFCSHCNNFDKLLKPRWQPNASGNKQLDAIFSQMLKDAKGKEYSCIMGLSGGVDSSYLAYLMVKKYNIKPLVVHVDCGWNSELAVQNIEAICKGLDLDLLTYVVDWREMADMQLSFLKASLANQDVPQDHAIFSKLVQIAQKHKIKYVLSGSNIATESILPRSWGHTAMDAAHLKSVHKKFGKLKLKNFPTVGFIKNYIYLPYLYRLKTIKPLNYLPFNKDEAIKVLENELGWVYYGGKHYESKFTKFFQSYYLPKKFGFDKRRAHLSSLIIAGSMTREQALLALKKPLYSEKEVQDEKEYIARKLNISVDEFNKILHLPKRTYKDYGNNERVHQWALKVKRMIKRIF